MHLFYFDNSISEKEETGWRYMFVVVQKEILIKKYKRK